MQGLYCHSRKTPAGRAGVNLRVFAKPLMLTLCLVVICGLWHASAVLANAAETPGVDQNGRSEETPEFHKLSNEELLKQTLNQWQVSLGRFRAEQRGLAKTQLLLKQAETASEAFHMPEDLDTQSVGREPDTLEVSKTKAGRAKARHDAHQQHVQLILAEKKQLELYQEQIKQARLAAESLNTTYGHMELGLLEIQLRVEDGTLAQEDVPEVLQPEALDEQYEELTQQREALSELAQSAPIKLKLVLARLEKAEALALEAEVEQVSAEKKHAEAPKHQELRQEYRDQAPDALSARLPVLQEELEGLNGAMQLAQNNFTRRQNEVGQLLQKIEVLTEPDAAEHIKPGAIVRADELDQKRAQAKQVIAYYDQHLEHTQALHAALTEIIKESEAYQSDASVLNEHVFGLQVPVGLLERAVLDGQAQETSIPDGMRSEQLSQIKSKAEAASEAAHTAMEEAKEQLSEVSGQIEKSQAAREAAEAYLEQLQHQAEAAEKAREWAVQLKDLTAEQVVARFQETAEGHSANQQNLIEARKTFVGAKEVVEEEQLHFDSLTDPLLRSAQLDAAPERTSIIKKLYTFAELEAPADLAATEAEATSGDDAQAGPTSVEQYQNLLATRERIIEERDEQKGKLKAALQDFKAKIEAYEKLLSDSDILLQQQYINAIELKKRIGRGQLSSDEIPAGITDALDAEHIEEVEAEMADLLHQAAEMQQQIDLLDQPSENLEKIRTSLQETIATVGKRLDVTRDLEKLQADIKRTAADRSKVEIASLEQEAARRLAADDSQEEQIYAYVPSTAADEVTDLMKVYYQELLELESKNTNLQEQTALTERLIELAETEKIAVADMLPMFQKQEALFSMAEEETWITVEAGLVPKKAGDLLDAYESKTGVRLSTPPAVEPDDRETAIATASELLFDRHADLVAAEKWTSLLQERLTEEGLDRELGAFQDQLGTIAADAGAIRRATHRLIGHPEDELAKLDESEAPKTESERQKFLRGEIGALRADRQKIRQQAIVDILIRLGIIVALAFVLTIIVSLIINVVSRRYRDAAVGGGAQTLLVLSFLKTLCKLSIWITAVILILSTLGFNVGAILAGLGIGGLAIAMAARETLSDMLGGIMIFVERPFVIGDTIQVGSGPVAKVVDMTWRTTKMLGTTTYYINVPNSQVANSPIQNFSRDKPICDWVTLYVSAEHDPQDVVAIANKAMSECDLIVQEPGMIDTSVGGETTLGNQTVMWYWPWWYMDDYHQRGAVRGEVWKLIWKHMKEAGIALDIKPIELIEDRHPKVGALTQSSSEG